jgi:hypothetical protein
VQVPYAAQFDRRKYVLETDSGVVVVDRQSGAATTYPQAYWGPNTLRYCGPSLLECSPRQYATLTIVLMTVSCLSQPHNSHQTHTTHTTHTHTTHDTHTHTTDATNDNHTTQPGGVPVGLQCGARPVWRVRKETIRTFFVQFVVASFIFSCFAVGHFTTTASAS